MAAKHIIDTTLGELIETVSEAAFELSGDPTEAYVLASLVLAEILGSPHSTSTGLATGIINLPRRNYFH